MVCSPSLRSIMQSQPHHVVAHVSCLAQADKGSLKYFEASISRSMGTTSGGAMPKTTFYACLLLLVLNGKELLSPLLRHAHASRISDMQQKGVSTTGAPRANLLLLLSFASFLFAGFNVVQAQTPQGEKLYNSHLSRRG